MEEVEVQGRVREWRWECGEMEKRVREVRSEEVRLRGALEQREREAIAHLREVSWKYVDRSLVWLLPGAKVGHVIHVYVWLQKSEWNPIVCIVMCIEHFMFRFIHHG